MRATSVNHRKGPGLRARNASIVLGVCLAACGPDGRDPGPSEPEPEAEPEPAPASPWHILAEDLTGALFSVNGTASDDVWIAGSHRSDGRGPILGHWDGRRWSTFDTGLEAVDLFWVNMVEGEVFSVGSEGTVLRDSATGFELMPTPGANTLWGVWGARADDVWAVGGEPSGGTGVVWRYQGNQWEAVDWTTQGEDLPTPSAWYKVWGSARDDVWFCGTEGALMHWDGNGFTAVDSATSRTLLTVHGRADGSLVTAVGGQFTATLVASEEGGDFRDVTPEEAPWQMLGVFHTNRVAYAVGLESFVLRKDRDEPWQLEDTELLLFQSLHGVYIDPDGGVWAAGGQVQTEPYDLGQLVYRGASPPERFDD
jgi:hypothetical protein